MSSLAKFSLNFGNQAGILFGLQNFFPWLILGAAKVVWKTSDDPVLSTLIWGLFQLETFASKDETHVMHGLTTGNKGSTGA